jgi:hydroxyacylglutathione hydrolase
MEVHTFVTGPLFANSYVVMEGKDAFIVDCGGPFYEIEDFVKERGLKVKYILVTHGHGDHIYGLMDLKEKTGAKIGIHERDVVALTHAFNLSIVGADPVKEDFHVKGKKVLEVGGLKIKVIETPGHSPGGVCYYLKDHKVMFTGDTLFKHAVGRDDFPGGSWGKLRKSLQKLSEMDPEIKIYPGHGEPSTIGAEKKFLHSQGLI